MEQGRFARYLFLVVLVVAVVGLLNSGFLEATGFAAKKTSKVPAVKKSPVCAAAEKASANAASVCKSAQNAYKPAPKKCDDAKKAYGLAQASYARSPSAKTKNLMEQKKKAMDTACAAVDKKKTEQDTKCADAVRAADNAKVVCAPPAPAQQAAPAQAAPQPAPEQQTAPQATAQAQAAAGPECTDSDAPFPNELQLNFTSSINYPVAGTVHGVGGQGMMPLDYADRCDSPTMLKEFYCSRGQDGTWATEVNYDCASNGKVCLNGACVAPFCRTLVHPDDYIGDHNTLTTNNGAVPILNCVGSVLTRSGCDVNNYVNAGEVLNHPSNSVSCVWQGAPVCTGGQSVVSNVSQCPNGCLNTTHCA